MKFAMINENANVDGAMVNNPTGSAPHNRSRFPDLSYHLFNTHRFGELSPHFVFDGEAGDDVPYTGSHKVDSYSLRAPLMQDISIRKDYYQVSKEAILPLNFKLWYTNPVVGDDVPSQVGCGSNAFWSTLETSFQNGLNYLRSYLNSTTNTEQEKLNRLFRFLTFYEMFYSNGSLLSSLGLHGAKYCRVKGLVNGYEFKYGTYDEFFDRVITALCGSIQGLDSFSVTYQGHVRWCVLGPSATSVAKYVDFPVVTMRDVLQMFRDDISTSVSSVSWLGSGSVINTVCPLFDTNNVVISASGLDVPFNPERLYAYQLVCAHFYTNDAIDSIYSADTFRQLIGFYCRKFNSGDAVFTINGIDYHYDWLSAYYLNTAIDKVKTMNTTTSLFDTSSSNVSKYAYFFFNTLFQYRRSLRYMDYFVGARSRPLAVGNVNIDVQSGSPNYVSVIDVTQNVQKQKFLNAVNRIGRKFEDYIQGLTGVRPEVDYHDPLYLAHTSDSAFAREVENTGVAQMQDPNSVTARLVSSGGRYQLTFGLDRPSIVIGITYFDIPRVYKYSTERQFYILNRFDCFNPYMQFIGDQPLYFDEIGTNRDVNAFTTFAYQLRHMEYKQRYNQCAGGFVHNLPAYIFDDETDNFRNHSTIDDDFIRSYNSELDPFYVSLNGWSYGSYFHFIVDHYNDCPASREMAYAPSIM